MNTDLLKDPNYCDLIIQTIRDTINENIDSDDQVTWEYIKINVRELSKKYSIEKSRQKKDRNKELTKKLIELDKEHIRKPGDQKIISEMSKTKAELEIFEMEKTRGAQIRARIKDIAEGEKCSKYFLALEKCNANNNTLKEIKNINGQTITDERKIVEEIGDQFKKRYNKPSLSTQEIHTHLDNFTNDINLPKLNQGDKDMCDSPITEREVAQAVISMNNGSAPGTDGIPVEFYKFFWQHLRTPLLKCFRSSFRSKKLPYSERLGVMSLIHKGKDLERDDINNWRPISLTNTDYKIIAKTLSRRLDLVIEKLIGEQQLGFMKGRNISSIHRIIDDLLDTQRINDSPGIVLAIDFKQAFDAINIDSILKTLKLFGFGDHFVEWISILNTDRLTCVKNGGHISRPFSMKNGVRQGCPISPQLFILAVEVLAQKIIQDINIRGLNPHNSNNPLKAGQFADDTSLFLRDGTDLRRAMGHLDNFSVFSGLYLNLNKSYALSTNGRHVDTEGININFKNTLKILGIFFSNKKSASEIEENWIYRIEKVKKLLKEWSKRKISICMLYTFLYSMYYVYILYP